VRGARESGSWATGLVAGAIVCVAPAARAQEAGGGPPAATGGEAEGCFAAAERAQPLMRQHKFREARADLETCARDVCPKVARNDCRAWLAQVVEQQPSIVIVGHAERGGEVHEVHGIRATVDGGEIVEHADAAPFAIDPGPHHLKLERVGALPVEEDVEVAPGDRERVIPANWRDAAPPPPPPPRPTEPARPVPPSVYVMGAVGAIGAGVGAYLEIAGLSKRSQLDTQCKPTRTCAQTDVDTAHDYTRAGDITLAGAGVFLAGALILYLVRPVEGPAKDDGAGWLVGPVPGGFLAGIQGRL